jgi:undecaprenyl pyrophosphate synthase
MLTRHATDRMQQRGFTNEHIDFILRFGTKRRVGPAVRYLISKKVAQKLKYQGIAVNVLEKCTGAYVVSENDIVITVAFMH